jgi:Arc/MetJ-type ribon-helix-helix transcriptional regulator
MDVSLTPELEKAVAAKVRTGLYRDAGEVIREALTSALVHDKDDEWIAAASAVGFAQLEAGQTIQVQSKDHFLKLVRGDS